MGTVISQKGTFAFALQKAKVGDSTAAPVFNPVTGASGTLVDAGFKRHKAIMVDLGPQEMIDMFPLEVGGGVVISGAYKNGMFAGGSTRIMPRLENSIAQLLYALTGSFTGVASAAADAAATAFYGAAGNISSGTKFYLDALKQSQIPWMTLAKYIPKSDSQPTPGVDDLTEYLYNCRVAACTLTIPGMGPLVAEFGYVGTNASGVTGEAVSTVMEMVTGVPLSCRGRVTIDSGLVGVPSDQKFTGAQIVLSNGLTQPDTQMVIGSYNPDDLVAVNRSSVVRLVYKWHDAELYKKLRYQGTSALSWQPTIQYGAITVSTEVPKPMAGFLNGLRLEFHAPFCAYSISQPTLAPGQMLQVEVTVVPVDKDGTGNLWELTLYNGVDYTVGANNLNVATF